MCRSNNLDVISYSRLPGGQNTQDCMARCRKNQECYSFNYNKLAKWCYLGTSEERDLRQTKNNKWAAGYRRCIEQINSSEWTNAEHFGGDDFSPPPATPSPPTLSPPPPSSAPPPPSPSVARTYVTNAGTFSLNVCVLDASGSFTTCQDTPASTINIHRPYGIGIIGYRLFMVANRDSYLVECTLSSTDGSVVSCARNNLVSTLHNPLALKVYNSRVYITNYGDSTVSTCTVDSVSSSITGCAKPVPSSGSGWKLNQPYGIAFLNDRAYITNTAANTVTVCSINPANGYFITCSDNTPTSGLGFNLASPTGIVILNNKAYIANSIYITICTISNTDGSLGTCTRNTAGLSSPYDMEILNLKLYIPNYGANTASVCALDASTGNILSCASTAPTSGLGFLMSNPYGIAIKTI
jgi:hypothetical protein